MLPIEILLPVAAASVALVIAIIWMLGGRRTARLDEAAVRALLAAEDPPPDIVHLLIGQDERAALAQDGAGQVWLAYAHGDRTNLRPLAAQDIRAAVVRERSGSALLELRLRDVARPWQVLACTDRATAECWRERLVARR
ncbi:hypothetical protein [Oceanibacterium hippocampi]|uniref:Uncharacterized protein n=1 Tax=Oceanibacterium hippocampi TaxID=745714 RepID=A0A1Y5TU51_9PROT|nr:hypothetical protein [Oceanibacterium hippocampi]SLN72813.1 hypothetical protein OCH7691_03514 [Oceanibacterium hippocampi]